MSCVTVRVSAFTKMFLPASVWVASNPFGILIGIGVPPHFFTVRQRKAVMDNAPMTAFGNLFEQLSEQIKDGLAHHHNHTDIHAAHRPFV